MIIGINGKIGSGKDTVGKIIQYLIATNNLPKDMQYESIDDLDHNVETFSNWKIKKFAGKLKTIASILTGIPVEDFEDQEFKKVILGEEWGTVRHNPLNNIEPFAKFKFNELMSVREFLQKLGTEAMRDGLHTNVWVNALFADYYPTNDCQQHADGLFYTDEHGENEVLPEYPNWIITDMRFENELEAVVNKGGITIKVVRNSDIKVQHSGKQDDFTIEKFDNTNPKHVQLLEGESLRLHPSEVALDGFIMHYEIINDGSMEELVEKVREILTKEKLI